MNPLKIGDTEFTLSNKDERKIIKLPGQARKDNVEFRHVTEATIFSINNTVMVCLKTDIKSKEYSDKWKKNV
jgi:hypothetical protein